MTIFRNKIDAEEQLEKVIELFFHFYLILIKMRLRSQFFLHFCVYIADYIIKYRCRSYF